MPNFRSIEKKEVGEPDSMPRLAREGRNGKVGEETRQVQRGGAEPEKDMGGQGRREEESKDKEGQGAKERERRGKLESSKTKP